MELEGKEENVSGFSLKGLGEQDVLGLSAAYGEPDWLRDRRLEAYKAFADLEWPHGRVEEWRHTDPRRFDLDREIVPQAVGAVVPERSGGIVHGAGALSGSVTIVDTVVVGATVCAEAAEQGVVVTDLADAARRYPDLVGEHLGSVLGTATKFDALSLAAFTGGAFVHVPGGVALDEPIAVSVHATSDGALLPRVLVVAGDGARAAVLVDHAGAGTATVVEAVEVVAGPGARVDLVTAQEWGDGVDHVGAHKASVRRDATYRHLEITLGGRTVYLRPDVALDEQGAHGELLGVYFTDEGQHFEHRSLIHHNASRTTSESVYKGALQGHSRAVWYGNIRIEAHAKATSSDETNRNLILSDGARADSIPFLEILTSDVIGCGHHSSVGQLDEQQLFYLEARGIPRPQAVRMLVFGFFAEVADRVDLPGVSETVLAEISEEIAHGHLALMNPRRTARTAEAGSR
jgi:Fe-S cluster assembly protein SufD